MHGRNEAPRNLLPNLTRNAQLTFDQTVQTLDGYFQPQMNLPFERHLFRKIEQAQNETVDQVVPLLRQKAISRGFDNVDEVIRDQVIEKCRSMHLRRKFLEKSGNILLKDLQGVARAFEAVDLQLKAMENPGASTDAQVNAVNKNKPKWKGKGKVLLEEQHLTGKRNRDATVAIDRDILRMCALHATRCVTSVESVVTKL